MRPTRIEFVWLPLVLAALLIIYLPGLGNRLVFDDEYLASGRLFLDYASLADIRTRMLAYGSFTWVRELFGDDWWKQRAVNVAIHAATVGVLWAFWREIVRHVEPTPGEYQRSPALGIAVGIFALNPVAVYAVAYLIQRSILMATLFTVLALWLFAIAVRRGSLALLAAAFLAYALGVVSKEYAILAPLAAIPVYILVARPRPARILAMGAVVAVLAGGVAYLLVKQYGEILGKPFDEYSQVYLAQLARLQPGADKNAFALSILNQSWLFFHYGVRWFIPVAEWMSINLRPPFPVTWGFPHVLGIVGYLSVLAGGAFLLLRYRDWRALLGLSLLLPALLFGTEFATVWVQDPFVLYRSYLWAIGVPGLAFLALHGNPVRVLLPVSLVIGGLLVWQALDRVTSLATPERAWTDAIRKLPDDPRSVGRWFPYVNRGAAYAETNQFGLALKDYQRASTLGDMGMGAFSAGSLLSLSGQHSLALGAFAEAEKQGYNVYNLPFQRGLALAALGRNEEAYAQLQAARAMNPPSPTRELVLLHSGRIAMTIGRQADAVRDLKLLERLDPRQREGRQMLAMALIMTGDAAGARTVADALVKEEPSARAYYARALANYGLKQKADASADIENAIRIGGDNPNLREWRAKIQAMK